MSVTFDNKMTTTISPLGGGQDDGFYINSVMVNLLSSGYPININFLPGLYTIASPILPQSNSVFKCTANTIFKSTMASSGSGGFTNSVIYIGLNNIGPTNALTSDAKIGSHTLVVTNPVVVGSTILLQSGSIANIGQQARVTAIRGSGPYTLTIDEEVLSSYFTVAASASIFTYIPITNVNIYGNGMRIYGTGDRAIEVAYGRYIFVDQVYVDQSLGLVTSPGFTSIIMSLDIATQDSGFSRCKSDGGNGYLNGPQATAGYAIEGGGRNYIRDSEGTGIRTPGAWVNTTAYLVGAVIVNGGKVYICTIAGTSAGSGGPTGTGAGITDGTVTWNYLSATAWVAYGVAMLDAKNNLLENITARDCTTGFEFGSNSGGGEGSREITTVACTTTGCGIGWNFEQASEIYCYNSSSVGDSTTIVQTGAGYVFFHGVDAKAISSGAYNFLTTINGDMYISGKIDLSTGSGTTTFGDYAGSGNLHLGNVKLIGGTYGLYVENATQKAFIGPDVDFSSATTPIGGPGIATATWTFYQGGYITIPGNTTIGWTQVQVLRVTAAATINVPAIPNMTYMVDNTASAGAAVVQPTGGASITVAAGKSAWLKVNNAGTAMLRVTADT